MWEIRLNGSFRLFGKNVAVVSGRFKPSGFYVKSFIIKTLVKLLKKNKPPKE